MEDQSRHGWQREISMKIEQHFRDTRLMPTMTEPDQALLRSQGSPLAAAQDEHQPPIPAKKVRGTQQRPDVLQKRGPVQVEVRVLGMEGVHNASANGWVSLVDHLQNSLPSLPRKRVL